MEPYDLGRPHSRGSAPPPWSTPKPDILPASSPVVAPDRHLRSGSLRLVVIPLISALIGAVLGVGATLTLVDPGADTPAPSIARTVSSGAPGLTGVADVAAKVIPSVVQVDTTQRSRFGTRRGTGSGVIYSADGLIITNKHVVEGGTAFQVTMSNGDRVPATLVGLGESDIAVLKVNKSGLPAATLGTDGSIHVGDVAVAVGSPYGLDGTVTAGVISALDREIDVSRDESLSGLLQTDAPINPGNSGGALVNSAGEVIGINTATVDGAGSLGFAISIDAVLREVREITGLDA
ncbi:MAG TPA: trypsin-like peptidase domain-containing protein [Actinomycetota bacterium]|nr:trypsin-like peptidase domain-containing protein [Actinomycetota bacterium]